MPKPEKNFIAEESRPPSSKMKSNKTEKRSKSRKSLSRRDTKASKDGKQHTAWISMTYPKPFWSYRKHMNTLYSIQTLLPRKTLETGKQRGRGDPSITQYEYWKDKIMRRRIKKAIGI